MPEVTTLVPVTCRKCGAEFKLDTKGKPRAEIEAWMKQEGFQCPGHHVEIGPRSAYWTIHWDQMAQDERPTPEELLNKLKAENTEVLTTQELAANYKVSGFAMGCCVANHLATGAEAVFNYTHIDPLGRYYYR